jgi:hypothetical protein
MWHVGGIWCEDLMQRDHVKELGLGGRIILKLIFKKWQGEAWTGFIWLRIGTVSGHFVNATVNLRVS